MVVVLLLIPITLLTRRSCGIISHLLHRAAPFAELVMQVFDAHGTYVHVRRSYLGGVGATCGRKSCEISQYTDTTSTSALLRRTVRESLISWFAHLSLLRPRVCLLLSLSRAIKQRPLHCAQRTLTCPTFSLCRHSARQPCTRHEQPDTTCTSQQCDWRISHSSPHTFSCI